MNWISVIIIMYVTHNGVCEPQYVGYATNNKNQAMLVTGDLNICLTHVTTYGDYAIYVQDSTFYSIKTEVNKAGLSMIVNELYYTGKFYKNRKPLHKRQYQTRKFRSSRSWRMTSSECN